MKTATARKTFLFVLFCSFGLCTICSGVTSKISRHRTAGDFIKGEIDNTVVSSEGTIGLAKKTTEIDLGDLLDNVWIINSIVTDDKGAVYLGTSPNGDIIKYAEGKAQKIYPLPKDCEEAGTSDTSEAEEPLTNEHIFAMAIDSDGRLLAAVSGSNCRLLRFNGSDIETVFSAEDVAYIFAIVLDKAGSIYLGTGPNGQVFRIDPSGNNSEMIYDARDNNILSLVVGDDGSVYAGCDQRGLVYRINQKEKTATVLYDADQDEITSLLLDDEGNLYAAATSAQAVKEHVKKTSISSDSGAGRPDLKKEPAKKNKAADSTTLEIANTSNAASDQKGAAPPETPKGALPKTAGRIYKITPEGFVTNVFSEMAVFYDLVRKDSQLLLATGNNAQLFSVNPDTEDKKVAYADEQSSQMTSLAVRCGKVFLGCANPAKLVRFEDAYVSKGTYTSSLIDAGQPAEWGKLQINAEIPKGCSILMSTHSGNVNDPNDPTFSPWTEPVEVTEAVQLKCPTGRFCQYELTLTNDNPARTPIVKEVAVAHVVGNLPPKVTSVKTLRLSDKNKMGAYMLSWTATDRNKDILIYTVEFRKLGRTMWIKLKDKLAPTKYEWNTNTVEDGRYEVRVIANDIRSNTPATAMTGSRISDTMVIDNTAPKIAKTSVRVKGRAATIELAVKDEYTAIGRVSYTVDSNEDWIATLPDDSVYDTTNEDFTIQTKDLDSGEHVVAVRIADDLGNTIYKTFDIKIK